MSKKWHVNKLVNPSHCCGAMMLVMQVDLTQSHSCGLIHSGFLYASGRMVVMGAIE